MMVEKHLPDLKRSYLNAMHEGSGRMADKVVENALDQQVIANEIYLQIFQETAYEIGRLWQRNEFTVAQEHLATAIIERQMGDLHPHFKPKQSRNKRLVIGSVDKEFHRVGVKMVADFSSKMDGISTIWAQLYQPTPLYPSRVIFTRI